MNFIWLQWIILKRKKSSYNDRLFFGALGEFNLQVAWGSVCFSLTENAHHGDRKSGHGISNENIVQRKQTEHRNICSSFGSLIQSHNSSILPSYSLVLTYLSIFLCGKKVNKTMKLQWMDRFYSKQLHRFKRSWPFERCFFFASFVRSCSFANEFFYMTRRYSIVFVSRHLFCYLQYLISIYFIWIGWIMNSTASLDLLSLFSAWSDQLNNCPE